MSKSSSSNNRRLRQMVASEAARIMAEEGIQDYRMAKDKAMRHLALDHDTQALPSNAEVHAEFEMRLRLFEGERQPKLLHMLREDAVQAMELLSDFDPRLVGSVLEGTATAHSDINLHLFADAPESVVFFFMDRHIPYELGSQHLRFGNHYRELPSIRFQGRHTPVLCMIFTLDENREAPLSRVTGKPIRRARIKQVQELLAHA